MVDYYGMAIGVSIAVMMFACMIFSPRLFSVSDEEYEKVVTEHGDEGLKWLISQKKKYGSGIACNDKLLNKLRQARIEEHYSKKDAKAKKMYDSEFEKMNKEK